MKLHQVVQRSPEWDALRAKHHTASEAPAMMGVSLQVKRTELLHHKATGTEQEFSDWFRAKILDKGHQVEALAKPIAEEILGERLYPATASDDDGYLLVSLDGFTMGGEVTWECKQYNRDLFAAVQAGECPPYHRWQVVQGLHITGAEKCLFMCSDGTRENTVWCWVSLREGEAAELLAGWKQFDADLATYTPPAIVLAAVPERISDLIAPSVQIEGRLIASNLPAYRAQVEEFIARLPAKLETDEDFAFAESWIKVCEAAEKRLDTAINEVLAGSASIDEVVRAMREFKAELRDNRLPTQNLVKMRKDQIRFDSIQGGKKALADHVAQLNERLSKVAAGWWPKGVASPKLAPIEEDFAGSIKNLKSFASMHDRITTHLAHMTIKANAAADAIQANIATLREAAPEHAFLFTDAAQLVLKANTDLVLVIESRMTAHRERVRQEELERDRAAAARKAADDAIQIAANAQQPSGPTTAEAGPLVATAAAVMSAPQSVAGGAAVAIADAPLKLVTLTKSNMDERHVLLLFNRAPTNAEMLGIQTVLEYVSGKVTP
jgi:predicted phage-related endonuclease